jgi:uncharacterized protein with FMN-binding domain
MKKGIVIILAVAIIGALGIYGKSHTKANNSKAQPTQNTSNSNTLGESSNISSTPSESLTPNSSVLKNGTFAGSTVDTVYGPVQIAVVISGGKITDVKFLQMPNDLGHTQEVTAMSEPLLEQETLNKQSFHNLIFLMLFLLALSKLISALAPTNKIVKYRALPAVN